MNFIVESLLLFIIVSNINGYFVINSHNNELDDHYIDDDDTWWKNAAFYQIYPRSFKDSNGDGIGDLQGIIQKLDYLQEIGIDAIWLSPIYKSPMADFGYDISDYFHIQPEYGTLDDFNALIKRAKELEIKVIIDFVPNHTSDENDWFIKSAKRESPYEDFYMWHPGYTNPDNTNRSAPSNWISLFWHSAWTFNNERKEFYLHQFHHKQPDLNYRNPHVVKQMKDVMGYWLDLGVDGFRIDAVPTLFEIKADSETGRYKDEPKSGWTNNTDDPSYLLHVYTQNQPETLDMVYQWREYLSNYTKQKGGEYKVMMTESYSALDIVMKYYGDSVSGREGSNVPFNFYFITNLNNGSAAHDVKTIIDLWLNAMPPGRTANWVLGNHDQKRFASRFGIRRLDGLHMIQMMLPGVSVTYYGDEIGMTDVWISWNDTVDPAACNTNPQVYEKYSRDPARTPMQWNNTTSAGFSTSKHTWLPVSSDYLKKNVQQEIESPNNTHLKVYTNLLKLRRNNAGWSLGSKVDVQIINSNVISITKNGVFVIVVFANWNDHIEKFNYFSHRPEFQGYTFYIQVVSVNSDKEPYRPFDAVNIVLKPYESIVLFGVKK